jgi:peptidoglycan/xylan/chitin deacetylase (PgdA/CDA1 family)
VILMYHRVAFASQDPWGLAVHPDVFEEQMAYIHQHRSPLSMRQFIERLQNGTLPANAVAVTFDDGYRDNLVNAKPVLVRYGVPATLFLATGFINQDVPFWWDELATMILASSHPVQELQVSGGEQVTLNWGEPERSDITGGWRASGPPQTARQSAYLEIWGRLRRMTAEERALAMIALRSHLGSVHDPLASPMTSEEISALLRDGLVQLGGHTVTHPALTLLSRMDSRREIADSRRLCSEINGKCVHGFAYPYGELNSEVRNDVVTQGLAWACPTQSGFVDTKPDPYALPRVAVPNAPMRMFVKLVTA